jgi:hypothetical protein
VHVSLDVNILGPSSPIDVKSTSMELESEVGCWGACPLELLAWFNQGDKQEKQEKQTDPGDPLHQVRGLYVQHIHTYIYVY